MRLFVEECDSLQVLPRCDLSERFSSHMEKPGATSIFGSSNVRVILPLIPFCLQRRLSKAPHPPLPVPRRARPPVNQRGLSCELRSPFTIFDRREFSTFQGRLRTALNDALCIVSAEELDTVNVPILPQSLWGLGKNCNTFQSSALVSTHIESVTLPMRFALPCFRRAVLMEQFTQGETGFRGHVGGAEPTELEERYSIHSTGWALSRGIAYTITRGCSQFLGRHKGFRQGASNTSS